MGILRSPQDYKKVFSFGVSGSKAAGKDQEFIIP